MTIFNKRKQEYIILTKEVEDLKQKVNTCEELITRLADMDKKQLDLIVTLTDKIWGKNE